MINNASNIIMRVAREQVQDATHMNGMRNPRIFTGTYHTISSRIPNIEFDLYESCMTVPVPDNN